MTVLWRVEGSSPAAAFCEPPASGARPGAPRLCQNGRCGQPRWVVPCNMVEETEPRVKGRTLRSLMAALVFLDRKPIPGQLLRGGNEAKCDGEDCGAPAIAHQSGGEAPDRPQPAGAITVAILEDFQSRLPPLTKETQRSNRGARLKRTQSASRAAGWRTDGHRLLWLNHRVVYTFGYHQTRRSEQTSMAWHLGWS